MTGEQIVKRLAELKGVAYGDVMSESRKSDTVEVRRAAAYILSELGIPVEKIGKAISRHHSNAIHLRDTYYFAKDLIAEYHKHDSTMQGIFDYAKRFNLSISIYGENKPGHRTVVLNNDKCTLSYILSDAGLFMEVYHSGPDPVFSSK